MMGSLMLLVLWKIFKILNNISVKLGKQLHLSQYQQKTMPPNKV
jgi:hypothetical protein